MVTTFCSNARPLPFTFFVRAANVFRNEVGTLNPSIWTLFPERSSSIAWAELYILFACVFRKLSMEIVDTEYVIESLPKNFAHFSYGSVDDFRAFKDYFVPVHKGRPLHIRSIALL